MSNTDPTPTTVPNPGSPTAVDAGCTCPVLDNRHGRGVRPGEFWMTAGCPLHGVSNAYQPAEKIGAMSDLSLMLEITRLRTGLRIIAGELPPFDNLLGPSDVARIVLHGR